MRQGLARPRLAAPQRVALRRLMGTLTTLKLWNNRLILAHNAGGRGVTEEQRERRRQQAREYRHKNKERAHQNYLKWYAEHREQKLEQNRQWVLKNKERQRELNRRSQEKNKEKNKHMRYKWHVKRSYGLTIENINNILSAQHNECAICHTVLNKYEIDHDHSTSIVRGILCRSCNLGLGHFKDNRSHMANAIAYLGEYQS